MTVKITVLSRTGAERTYIDPKGTYIFQNKNGDNVLASDDGETQQLIVTAEETAVIPAQSDIRIWDCYLDDEGGVVQLSVTQHRVIGWKLSTSLVNEEQIIVPLAPTLDGSMDDYPGSAVFLLDAELKTAYHVIRRSAGHIEMDETGSNDLLALMSHVLKHPITKAMLPPCVFTEDDASKLISPANVKRSK